MEIPVDIYVKLGENSIFANKMILKGYYSLLTMYDESICLGKKRDIKINWDGCFEDNIEESEIELNSNIAKKINKQEKIKKTDKFKNIKNKISHYEYTIKQLKLRSEIYLEKFLATDEHKYMDRSENCMNDVKIINDKISSLKELMER